MDQKKLEDYIKHVAKDTVPHTYTSITDTMVIDDKVDIDLLIWDFRQYEENERLEQERKMQEELDEENRKKIAMQNMLITSGFNFDGYRVVKYSGFISGDDVARIDRETLGLFNISLTDIEKELSTALKAIRRQALTELKEAAYELGCNAVIGVDYDYITFEPESARGGHTVYMPYIISVTANGNAVVIEPIDQQSNNNG